MLDRYCFQDGRLQPGLEEDTAGRVPAAVFHLSADGALRTVAQAPPLQAGEGYVMYAGDFYVEPLEIQIEFIKAESAQRWLEALLLRHTDRVRQIEEKLWVLAAMEEVKL